MSTDDKSFNEALEAQIEAISGSAVFCSLYSEGMADFRRDPGPAIQLAIAILLDKPIVVACLAGRMPPRKLVEIADEVIYADTIEELLPKVAEASDRLVP